MARAMERLREHVQQSGGHWSDVREAIAKAALGLDGHFSIDDLRSELPSVNAATAYRVFPLLIGAGLIEQAPGPGDGQRYERAFEREQHDHLVCKGCGCVVEFNDPVIEKLKREVAARFGFEIGSHVQHLHGVCAKCQRRS